MQRSVMFSKTKMNMACVSSHRCLVSIVVRKREFRLKRFIYFPIFLDKNKTTIFICLINHGISPSIMYSCKGIRYTKPFEVAKSMFKS